MAAERPAASPNAMQMGLVSVNVGLPAYLGQHRGRPIESGIAKRPVTAEEIELGWLNLEGDGQAELDVHGGRDKAVYAYPSEHLPAWSEELGQELRPAAFGENLTTVGGTEDDVCIGDRWEWGEALLEVAEPRWPCYKLAMYRGRGDIQRRLRQSGRTGWYMRVLQPGRVPVSGPITVVERHPAGATVRLCHDARSPSARSPSARSPSARSPSGGVPPEVVAALVDVEPLGDEWRGHLLRVLANLDRSGDAHSQ
ncbi:MAG TPA: MOSC domain-containing protein [Acidimicrobiales bacterium]|nr:MOSC domain-containing protein [Acidimicrobiales bacterium]